MRADRPERERGLLAATKRHEERVDVTIQGVMELAVEVVEVARLPDLSNLAPQRMELVAPRTVSWITSRPRVPLTSSRWVSGWA